VHEVPTGTPVFDWTVPKEWNIRDAYVKNSKGERIIDFNRSNLHVVSYSTPQEDGTVRGTARTSLTLPDHPDWILSHVLLQRELGFCLSHAGLGLTDDE
jgi:aminopeptidase-like protein